MDGKYVVVRDDELYHHGILGQKWGVRRFQNADGSLTPAGLKRQARQEARAEKKAQKKLERTSASKLSDEQLQKIIRRKQLEKQYNDLTTKPDNKSEVGELLKNAALDFGRKALTKIVDKSISKLFDKKEEGGVEAYTLKDPTKATLSQLQEANKYFAALKNYRTNRDEAETEAYKLWAADRDAKKERQASEKMASTPSKPVTLKDLGIGDTSKLTLKDMTAAIDEYKKKNPGAVIHSDLIETSMNDFLSHSGKKGMKWGERNYEDYDGHLTAAGKARYLGKNSGSGSDSGSSSKTDSPWGAASTKDYSGRAKGSKKKGKGGGKGGKGKKGSGSEKAAVEKKDWRDRFAEELKKANMTDEQLQEALDKLYPDRKKKIGVGQKTVKHSEEISMDDNTHFIIERDGEYLEHFGIKGMKWKKRKAQGSATLEDPKANKDFKPKDVDRRLASSYEVKKRGPEYSDKWRTKNRMVAGDVNSNDQLRADSHKMRITENKYGQIIGEVYNMKLNNKRKNQDKPRKHKISAKDKATRFIKKLFGG